MTVRAKFKCVNKRVEEQNGVDIVHLMFQASYGEGLDNKDWSKWTPSGNLQMSITNPGAFEWFQAGVEYYLDFTAVEALPS